MKRLFKKYNYLAILLFLSVSLTCCKLDTSHNGKLDGYWKLCTIDDLTLGEVTDLTEKSIFWAVEKDLLVARDNDESPEYVFRFSQSDSELTLRDGQRYNKKSGNETVSDISVLYKYGIYSQPITYRIDELSRSKMMLSTDDIRLNFKKF